MGAIVTMPVEMQPHGVSKFLLIDGQQRLTTIILILACIRDLGVNDGQLAKKIDELYLHNRFSEERNRHKLLPTQFDLQPFRAVLDGKRHIDSPISRVYRHYKSKLRQSPGESQPLELTGLLETLIERLAFASIVIDKDDNPYRIFHSLNGTGEVLTQSDLIRNHIFMHIDDSDEEEVAYQDYWLRIQSSFDKRKTLDDFMTDFVLKDGEFISKNSVYDRIRHATSQVEDKQKFVQDLLENLKINVDYYLKLVDPSNEPDQRLSGLLRRLNSLRIRTPYPFLLNLYRALDEKRLSIAEMCQIIETIESYLVRRYFCKIHSRGLTHIFVSMYKSVSRDPDIVRSAQEYLLNRKFPNDEEFMKGWETYPIYGTGIQDRSKFVLEALETHLKKNNEPVDFDYSRISREHVMPRNLSEDWRVMHGFRAASTHENLLHTVGNLTLSGQNESMSNKAFREKKKVLAQSSFALNEYFYDCVKWDEDEILKRARCLGEVALEIWKRPHSTVGIECQFDSSPLAKATGRD